MTTNEQHREKRRRSQDLVNSKFYEDMINGPVDMERRLKAQNDFKYFCEVYNAPRFSLAWSDYHLEAIEKIEEVVKYGASYALTMPRGSGKSTLCQAAEEWAALCGWSPYSIFIGSTASAASTRRDSIKTNLRFNDALYEDFPEILGPIRFCEGEARRAAGQRWNGETTGIAYGSDIIQLPYLHGFETDAKWYKDVQPNLGAILDFGSIDGSLRGRSVELPTGKIVRPRVAIVDDPQTRESAANPLQVDKRERTLKGDIAYLGGPDSRCGVMVPCTVIYEDDLADRLMDHVANPEFRGSRAAMLESMPGDGLDEKEKDEILKMWEVEYDEKRRFDLLNGTSHSRDYYIENREKMDKGAVASWTERFGDDEVSAIQSAMNLYLKDEMSFYCEAQNQPVPVIAHDQIPLTPADIMNRTIGIPRGRVPAKTELVTGFIDVSRNVLWWGLIAYDKENFGQHIVEYGCWPEQGRQYVQLNALKKTIPDTYPEAEYSAALTQALEDCVDHMLDLTIEDENGDRVDIEIIGIDSGWGAEAQTVYNFCRRSRHRRMLVATKGFGSTPLKRPLVDPEKKREKGADLVGQWKFTRNVVKSRLLNYDTNLWKSKVDSFCRTSKESSTALTLCGPKIGEKRIDHRMIAEQMVAEKPVWLEGNNGRRVEIWQCPPGKDNHFLDVVVGCNVLAHVKGAKLPMTTVDVQNRSSMNKQHRNKQKQKTQQKKRRKRVAANF
jgi:hypothetical protein